MNAPVPARALFDNPRNLGGRRGVARLKRLVFNVYSTHAPRREREG